MITNFNIFESISVPYKVGDFILIKLRSKGVLYDDILAKINKIQGDDITVEILDDRIDKIFLRDTKITIIRPSYIQCWSENRKELEEYRTFKKYNL